MLIPLASALGTLLALIGVLARAHWTPRHNPARIPFSAWFGKHGPLRKKALLGCAYFVAIWFPFALLASSLGRLLFESLPEPGSFAGCTVLAIAPPSLLFLLKNWAFRYLPRRLDQSLQDVDELTMIVFTDTISSTLGRLLKELESTAGSEAIDRVFSNHLDQAAEYFARGGDLERARSQMKKIKQPMTKLRFLVNHEEIGFQNLCSFLRNEPPTGHAGRGETAEDRSTVEGQGSPPAPFPTRPQARPSEPGSAPTSEESASGDS